ncbi:hypothetical protein Tco_1148681 [Tanacetum coccineum]
MFWCLLILEAIRSYFSVKYCAQRDMLFDMRKDELLILFLFQPTKVIRMKESTIPSTGGTARRLLALSDIRRLDESSKAYRDKWHALRRGCLRTADWDAVAEDVGRICPGVTPPKTSAQCRHKMEKLRQRYRVEKQRELSFGGGGQFVSNWFYFEAMESLERNDEIEVVVEDNDNDGNKDEGNLSEEHHDQDDHTDFVFEGFDATDAVVTPDLERKSDETEEVAIEEEKDASDVKSGDTEELDLEEIQSPSSLIHPTQEEGSEEQFKDDKVLADILLNRSRGLSIPGPMQSQPQQPTQATDPKEKGKGILVEEPKKKKLTLQQIRALETANDEEVARKWGSE